MFDPLAELVHLIARWVHLIAGIMWIGNSMLWNWIDRNLETPKTGPRKGLVGEIWMVHSGGFYMMEKLALSPSALPENLHWFKWQNFTTWASGISLMVLVYYMSAASMMVDPEIAKISSGTAIAISAASLPVAWILYATVWRVLGKNVTVSTLLTIAIVIGCSAVYFNFFSGRAAYMHVGILLGTIMTGNVWFVILPSQRELIAATKEGREQDPAIGYQAKQRSVHNNYFTFPLLFIMLSGHFPSTYGHPKSWLILLVLCAGGAVVRHGMNVRFTTPMWLWPTGFAALGSLSFALVMMSDRDFLSASQKRTTPVEFSEVAEIVHIRCSECHATVPTNPAYKVAPNGVSFDSAEMIVRQAPKIEERAVKLKNMPLANVTGMTQAERETIRAWIAQGAKGP